MAFTIGADIEVFAKDKVGHHKAICGLIGGTKEKPLPVGGIGGFALQEDNVSLEFNIPAAANRSNFIAYINFGKQCAESALITHDLFISNKSSVSFPKTELTHPNALIFGCEPDYDAWKMVENKKPKSTDQSLRTAAGHVHIGTEQDMVRVVRKLDLFLGVPSIILDNTQESHKRRELYGKAGAMRPKPYGLEYRVLSNFWIFNEELIGWVFDGVKNALAYRAQIKNTDGEAIVNCINTGDVNAARDICKHFGITYPQIAG